MCAPLLSPELALRIGLAAGALEEIDSKTLLPVLIDMVGLPLTKDRFAKITVTGLKVALAGNLGQDAPEADYGANPARRTHPSLESLKAAVRYLWGFTDGDEALPPLEANIDKHNEGSIRVAVATTDGEHIDEHFGGCRRFFVYRISPAGVRLVDFRSTVDSVDAEDQSGFRAELLQDCQVLYVQSIGGPAAAKVIQRGIYPLKVEDRPHVSETLGKLQTTMAESPPPWLAKAMNVPVENRIRFR